MANERSFEPDIGAKRDPSGECGRDRAIAELAERQHGVVARTQLLAIGLSRRAIGHRLDADRLHPIHRGVYAVGHPSLSMEGRWLAAVLAGGPGAALSHRSAAALWGLRPSSARVEVTVAHRRRSYGIGFHRGSLPDDEATILRGIPVTTVPRTLFDLAAVLDRRQVERAIHEAEVRRLTDPLSLDDLIARHPRRRGVVRLKDILAARRIGSAVTHSELEERFRIFLDEAGLPRPEVNTHLEVGGRLTECDCIWRAEGLIAELDGHATHATAVAFERDRARDRALHAAGWRVIRITWRQLHDDPAAVATDLRTLLSIR